MIGFDVQNDERASLEGIAQAGKGKYYNAQNASELVAIVKGLQKELEVIARPAPTGKKVVIGAGRFVRIDPSAIELPPVESIYLARAGIDRMALRADHIARIENYGHDLRIPPSVKVDRFDVWWVPEQGRAVCMKKGLAIGETEGDHQARRAVGVGASQRKGASGGECRASDACRHGELRDPSHGHPDGARVWEGHGRAARRLRLVD